MTTSDVELVELQAQPAAVVRGHVTVTEIPAFIGGAFADVLAVLSGQRLVPTGPPFGRYVPVDGAFDVDAGFPASGVVDPVGRVVPCDLPGGPAARVLYKGGYAGVAEAYTAATDWVGTHGYVATEPPWESYLDGPEVAEPRTVVHLPCRTA